MLALSIALGTIILFAIYMAIMVKTGEMETTETPGIETEKLLQDVQANKTPGLNGSSVAPEPTVVNNVETFDNKEVAATILTEIFGSTREKVSNIEDNKSLKNRTETALTENTTIADKNGYQTVGGGKLVLDENKAKALEASNDTITDELNRGTATGSLLYWHFVIYSFLIVR